MLVFQFFMWFIFRVFFRFISTIFQNRRGGGREKFRGRSTKKRRWLVRRFLKCIFTSVSNRLNIHLFRLL